MKKFISMILVLAVVVTVSLVAYKSYYNIDVTLSTVIERADLKNQNLIYAFKYPDNYEEESGFNVYNFYLKIDNHSKFDVYNAHVQTLFQHSDYEIHNDTMDSYEPFCIKSGESGTIALTICIKNDLSDTEIQKMMHKLPKVITLDLVDPEEENPVNYSKTSIFKYDLTDDNFSGDDVQYPICI